MRYDFDPTAVSATFKTFPKGDYEFSVGEPRSFKRTSNEGKETFGVRFPCKCEEVVSEGDPKMKGERAVYSAYLHGEANPFVKQFLMAVLGFSVDETGEKAFDEKYKGYDWSFDPDNGTVGDMWSTVTGGRLIASMDIQMWENEPRQQWASFRPVGEA